MQTCLARLYVDEGFRATFLDDPAAALAGSDVAPAEAAAIAAIDLRMLVAFAATLYTKRKKRFQRAYAASFAWREPVMDAALRRFLETHGTRPAGSGHLDIHYFGCFAEQELASGDRPDGAAADLVRFERLSHDATLAHPEPPEAGDVPQPEPRDVPVRVPGVQVDDFRYDVVAMDAALRAGDPIASPQLAATTLVLRPGPVDDGEQRILRMNGAAAMVLRLCEGRTVAAIVHAVETRLAATDLADAVRDTVRRLCALHIVSLSPRRAGP